MREWVIFGIGAAAGIAIGIAVGEAFEVSRLVGKLLALAGATLGGCTTIGIATMAGWIKDESETA